MLRFSFLLLTITQASEQSREQGFPFSASSQWWKQSNTFDT